MRYGDRGHSGHSADRGHIVNCPTSRVAKSDLNSTDAYFAKKKLAPKHVKMAEWSKAPDSRLTLLVPAFLVL